MAANFSLKNHEVQVWSFDLSYYKLDEINWKNYLTSKDIMQSKTLFYKEARAKFIIRHGIRNILIQKYTGLLAPKIEFEFSPHGKPTLVDSSLQFSTSSSNSKTLIAFTRGANLGIDVEAIKPIPHLDDLVAYGFSPQEQTEFSILPPEIKPEIFFHIWTQKEAFLKAIGKGLAIPPQAVTVSTSLNESSMVSLDLEIGLTSNWKTTGFCLGVEYRGAICTDGSESFFLNIIDVHNHDQLLDLINK